MPSPSSSGSEFVPAGQAGGDFKDHAQPLVTVVTPCFNMAPYLEETLRSVQAQTLRDFEVIMVDDGSTDETLSVMRRFASADARFKVVRFDRNRGVTAARNAALAQARGEYVALLDGDDLWTRDALAMRVDLLRRFPSAIVVATEFARFEGESPANPVGRVGLGSRAKRAFAHSFAMGEPSLLEDAFELAATLHFAWVGATLVRRSAMTAIGNFEPAFEGPEDTLLWLRLAQRGAFLFTPQITAYYRQRAGSISDVRIGPAEIQHLKALYWVRHRPEFAAHANVVRRIAGKYHYTCAQYFRRLGDTPAACRHALRAVGNQAGEWVYWRELAAASIHALRGTICGTRR
jgi:glycosyltransferase involved in cell wall biosynthesis